MPATRHGERHGIVRACAPIARALTVLAMLLSLASTRPARARDGGAPDAAYPLPCIYFRSDLDRFEACARREGGMIRIAPSHVARLRFQRGLAEVRVPGVGCLWARPDGLALPVFTFDNGADPFEGGLTRSFHDGKVAFHDRRLRLVLATGYDWSFPFDGRGEALVCEGCKSDGREPASMVGGRWGIIDRKGRLVVPLTERREAFERFFGRSG